MNNKETKEIKNFRGFENKVFKQLEIWKRKLVKVEEKVRKLSDDRNVLINLLNEVKTNKNIRLNNFLKDLVLKEEISHLEDWIEFYKGKVAEYEKKIRILEKEISQQELEKIKEEVKLERLVEPVEDKVIKVKEPIKEVIKVEEKLSTREESEEIVKIKELLEKKEKEPQIEVKGEKEVKKHIKELFVKRVKRRPFGFKEKLQLIKKPIGNIFDNITKLYKNRLIRHGVPIILLLLIISILFISKPEITGHVVLTQERTYDDNLDLIINESGNYTWTVDKIGDIKSIKASGRVKGNGSVKIYIEKDGERYLIFNNKETDSMEQK